MRVDVALKTPIKPEFKELVITQLVPGKYQPRDAFDEASLEELATTIKRDGILQYLLVRPLLHQPNQYEIIAGERRWRAAQIAKLEKVPCLVGNYTDEAAARLAIVENTARQNLSPIQEAQAIERLIIEFEYTHEEVAKILGKPRTQITNLLRLLKLDPRVRLLINKGKLTESHGKSLAGIAKHEQFTYAKDAIAKEWSVLRLEQEIKKQNKKVQTLLASNQTTTNNPHLERLKRRLSEHLASPVEITFDDKSQQKGKIEIRFFSLDEFESILSRVGYQDE
jgi:ParB family chromosome partitioning protein